MSVDVRVVLLVKDDAMGEHLYPYIGAETLGVYICTDSSAKRWTFTLSKFDEPFGVRFHFENFWEPMSIGVKVILLVGGDIVGKYLHPYIESRTLRVNTYVHYGYRLINKEIDSHLTKNLTSLSAFGSILKKFSGNRCRLV
jgi:hypothetical protein